MEQNPHLFVVKSISKSYGVPGLRLGVLASGNDGAVAQVKKSVSIWNINSFAEFYMQIEEKYKTDYQLSLVKLKTERERFMKELSDINGMRVVPSQANYIMAELTGKMSSKEFTEKLLEDENILIKDLSEKLGGKNYVRIAVRNEKENNIFLDAARRICKID